MNQEIRNYVMQKMSPFLGKYLVFNKIDEENNIE